MPGHPLQLRSSERCRRPPARRRVPSTIRMANAGPLRSIGLPLALVGVTIALVLAAALSRWDADRATDPSDQRFGAGQAVLAGPDTLGCILKAETLWRYGDDDTPGARAQRRFMEINPKTCHVVGRRRFVLQQSIDDHVTEVAASPEAGSGVWVPTDTLRPAPPLP